MAWAPDYITLDDLKGYLEIPLTDTQDDVDLAEDITTASRTVDNHCSGGVRRQFGNSDLVERTYELSATYLGLLADIDDLQNLTDLVVEADGTTLTADQYVLHERNALADGRPYEWIVLHRSVSACEVAITARWGWTAVPAEVKTATKLQAAQLFKRRRAPFGIAGSPDLGGGTEPVRLLAIEDPHLRTSLKRLVRTGAMG